jgi:cytochrome c5/cytochrome c553
MLRRTPVYVLALFVFGAALLTGALVLAADESAPPAQDMAPPGPDGAALLDYILNQNPYTQWGTWTADRWTDFSGYIQSGAPHGNTVRLFVNDVALEAVQADDFDGVLPYGSIIVKENYGGSVDDPGALAALTVMYKVEGYNPDAGDWFWLKAAGDGSAIDAEGKIDGCIGCHSQEGNADYLLRYAFGDEPAVFYGEPLPDGATLVSERCTVCHTADRIDNKIAQGVDRAQWEDIVGQMIGMGAQLDDREHGIVLDYLVSATQIMKGETLVSERCTVCHTTERIDEEIAEGADRARWQETVDDMIGKGAQLDDVERAALLKYLISATQAAAGTGETAALDGNALVDERCTVCHSRDRIDNKKASGADRTAWEATVDGMIARGAQLNDAEREAVLDYLAGE